MDSGAPQSPQKRLPAGFSLPQLEQRIGSPVGQMSVAALFITVRRQNTTVSKETSTRKELIPTRPGGYD
jgi:hypothetical protein